MQGSRLPELWQELIDFERSATAIINYEPLLIPGLLQTADYAGVDPRCQPGVERG